MTNPEPKTVTLEQINAEIVSEHCFTAQQGVVGASIATGAAAMDGTANPLNLLTICVLVLKNGHKVVGINHGALDPSLHSQEMGRKMAREDAVEKVRELLAFRLRDQIAAEQAAPASKRYSQADIADLEEWVAECVSTDPFGERANVRARMKDGKEFIGSFSMGLKLRPESISAADAGRLAVDAILRAANGEA